MTCGIQLIRMSYQANVAFTPNNIQDAIDCQKNSKQDGVHGLMTDNFVHLPECFFKLISDFYNSCIIHGFIPDQCICLL